MSKRKYLGKLSIVLISLISPVLLGLFIFLWQFDLAVKLNKHSIENAILQHKYNLRKPKDLQEYLSYANFEKEKIVAENAVRATLFTGIGGLFFIVTTYFTWENIKISKKTLKATEKKQISEQFNQAVQLLADEKKHVNLGGIYALAKIADTEEYYYEQVMEMLTAYVRENTSDKEYTRASRTNIHVILIILSKSQYKRNLDNQMNKSFLPFMPDLHQTDLSGIKIGAKGDLSIANLVLANLQEANLMSVNLKNADLTEANLMNANLADANLTGAKLKKANLIDTNFANTTLKNTRLQDTDLSQARNLKQEQIATCYWDDKTQFPPDIKGNPQFKKIIA